MGRLVYGPRYPAKSENAQLERLNGQRSNAGAAPASIWYLSSLLVCPKARRRAHRGDGFVECRENPRLADRRCDVMSVHVGPKVPTDTREDHADPLARQIIEQTAHGLRGGVVYICDRACHRR